MIRLCPSILNANFADLNSEIAKVAKQSDLLHLDVMDNIFVPNQTFSLSESERIIKESPLPVDAHLMIANPDVDAAKYAKFGAKSVTVHFEALKNIEKCIEDIHSAGSRVGIALKPKTDFSQIAKYIELIDMVLIMTVEPGFGGQSFMENMMEKVRQARSEIDTHRLRDVWLQVDGGISLATIETAYRAGADAFVAGSSVFKSDDPGGMVDKLRAIIS